MRLPSIAAWSLETPELRARRFEATADDGAVLRGITAGPENGPTIVFAHCWTGNWTVWEPVAARLASTHRVVLWDHRDHGSSDTSTSPASAEILGDDLIAVMDHLGINRAILAGHSMGGMASLAATLAHPERVMAVGLFSTSAAPSAWPSNIEKVMPAVTSLIRSKVSEGRLAKLLVRPSLGRKPEDEAVRRTLDSFRTTPGELRATWLDAIGDFDVVDRLKEIDVPCAVLCGRRDLLLPLPHARTIHEHLPTSSLTVLARTGHMTPLERPDAVADLLTALVAAAEAPPTSPAPARTPILQGANR